MSHFTQKVSKVKKINLIEKGNVISSDEEIFSPFNNCFANTASNLNNDFFANTVSSLNIPAIEHSNSNLQNADSILATINSHEKHPRTERIKVMQFNVLFQINQF